MNRKRKRASTDVPVNTTTVIDDTGYLLTNELWYHIISFLDQKHDRMRFLLTCQQWHTWGNAYFDLLTDQCCWLKWICKAGDVQELARFLSRVRADFSITTSNVFLEILFNSTHDMEIIQILLKDGRFIPVDVDERRLCFAIVMQHTMDGWYADMDETNHRTREAILVQVLQDELTVAQYYMRDDASWIFRRLIELRRTQLVQIFLNDPRILLRFEKFDHYLDVAIQHDCTEIALMIWNDPLMNIPRMGDDAMISAIDLNRVALVRSFLKDKRLDICDVVRRPGMKGNGNGPWITFGDYCLRRSIRDDRVETFPVLLADPRIDPCSDDYEALKMATRYSLQHLLLLLRDVRVHLHKEVIEDIWQRISMTNVFGAFPGNVPDRKETLIQAIEILRARALLHPTQT